MYTIILTNNNEDAYENCHLSFVTKIIGVNLIT